MTGLKNRRSSSSNRGKAGGSSDGGVRRRNPVHSPRSSTITAKASVNPTGVAVGMSASRRRNVPPTAVTNSARSFALGAGPVDLSTVQRSKR